VLVLSRRLDERIFIGAGADQIVITVVEIDRGRVRLGIQAPRDVPIFREELLETARVKATPEAAQ
jgi:carbon storage regulator